MITTTGDIKLRRRELPSGRVTLFLDLYKRGRRYTEALGLYLVPETSRADKARNKEVLRKAELIRARRQMELDAGKGVTETMGHVPFYAYLAEVVRRKEALGLPSVKSWVSLERHLLGYEPDEGILLSDIDRRWMEGFAEYLSKAQSARGGLLAPNTRQRYWKALAVVMNSAVRDGLIKQNPMHATDGVSGEAVERAYLTREELRRLAETPVRSDTLRRTFLFSCLTGLRYSDVKKLTWGEVRSEGKFTRLVFRQKKTGGQEYLDIPEEAVELMGERGESDAAVFDGMLSPQAINIALKKWAADAGIDKHVTFHSGRHTYAVMMLDLGVDIYTVSKLLGHTNIATTQIYAKVLDKNKRAAVEKIPRLLGGLSGGR